MSDGTSVGATVRGGCLCGAIRYAVDPGGLFDAGWCHCGMCRKAHGAMGVAWALFQADAVRIEHGTAATYRSSPACERRFCGKCGSPLFYVMPDRLEWVGVQLATLDQPPPISLRPRLHMCVADRWPFPPLPDDGLPRFTDNRLSDPATRS